MGLIPWSRHTGLRGQPDGHTLGDLGQVISLKCVYNGDDNRVPTGWNVMRNRGKGPRAPGTREVLRKYSEVLDSIRYYHVPMFDPPIAHRVG